MSLPPLTMIVAATRANGIGLSRTNALPWRLPKEMAYFARVTTAAPEGKINAVVMGRNTWESIPERFRPLKGRWNVVLSSREMPQLADIPNAIHLASLSDLVLNHPSQPLHRIFIIGGASLYKSVASHPSLNRLLITRILSPAYEDCDVSFPSILDSSPPISTEHEIVKKNFASDGGQAKEEGKRWSLASHDELQTWVGAEVPVGVQEEKGTTYEFQMWVCK
ncbi:hypothetical protein CALVIDRAFT_500736 [Calocera viscosa TUFC12733]|uniref:Dihydrofolate reductase n=1 Tax=Calocera viscosa (strain TUFC12733) TaxID=1330018 RepID=A0A167KV93_CALVF|nr:hypothetical protein CALVIDRAFT_500736 [Calocera viscosa TUFC12733]